MILLVAFTMAFASLAEAAIEAKHPSDFVRVLEAGEPALWDEAVSGLLGDDDELPQYAVASVVRRLPLLRPELRARVAGALRRHGHTLPTLWELAHEDPERTVRETAMDSLLRSGAPGLMDACRDLIELESPYRMEALHTLVSRFELSSEIIEDGNTQLVDPVLAPANGTPAEIFDRRYLHTVSRLLYSQDSVIRAAALSETSSIDTPGLRDAWLVLSHDIDASIRSRALWTLANKGDPRPCPILFAELTEEGDIKDAGAACAATHFLDYFERYERGENSTLYKLLIEGATSDDLLAYPEIAEIAEILDAMTSYAAHPAHPDRFLSATAQKILDWNQRTLDEQRAADVQNGVRPALLMVCAFVSFVLGVLLFVWTFRLYTLLVRVRHRPVAKIASMAMGPVALEGKVQPASGLLHHPLTDEPCVYYPGADVDHPETRFYLVDDSGRVLIDPRRAVLFSDDGVLVTDESVHLVGHADRAYGKVVVGKDSSTPPLYRRAGHRIIEALFGFGQRTSVTKMLFTDPSRCFWIWDDLERRPMGETRDVLWLAASVLLAAAWIVVFAVSVLGMIDQEMSTSLAEALTALTS
ncbi:MAG: hypothetical protein BMS9Abin37_0772 [Acidobacteriota bacterium]|nr:MAG: hypothetical protein BMS9Abin37_0772 [Acidobacteriota bacterium]